MSVGAGPLQGVHTWGEMCRDVCTHICMWGDVGGVCGGCAHTCTRHAIVPGCVPMYVTPCTRVCAYNTHICVRAGSCMMWVASHPLGCVVCSPRIVPGCSDSRLPILPSDLTTGVRWEDHGVSSWDSAGLGAASPPDQLVPGV